MIQRRWYDKNPEMLFSIDTLLRMPEDIQIILAEGIAYLLDQQFATEKRYNQLNSLGVSVVLTLYKSKRKNRDYDIRSCVHRAMNHLAILHEEEQLFMAQQIAQLHHLILDYLRFRQQTQQRVMIQDVERLVHTAVVYSPDQAKQVLTQIRGALHQNLQARYEAQPMVSFDTLEMRLRSVKSA